MKITNRLLFLVPLVWTGFALTARATITYTVSNLNATGAGSFAAALASAESDGQPSKIVFTVGGTIKPGVRQNLTAGSCTIYGDTAPAPGITFDFNSATMGFNVTSSNNWITNIRVINTLTNSDGITLAGSNNVVERCSFDLCRDEAVGITNATSRGNVVAYCRIENCGSQASPWSDGRGILVTVGASATIVGNYVYHCNRGMTVNSSNSFADIRNNRVETSLSTASGNGITVDGPAKANVMNSVSSYNALNGYRYKTAATIYKTGNTGTGNALNLESSDANIVFVGSIQTVADTPYPSWLVGATTPANASAVGMGTGASHAP